jgi:D-serine deaminase-like pyridoxal phosphate-dependent protein
MDNAGFEDLTTPAALVDSQILRANLDRMAQYTHTHGLALRPHIKTHKTREITRQQIARGAAGVTVATIREAHVMASVAADLLIAYPPVGRARLEGILGLPRETRVTVALDSSGAAESLSAAASSAGRTVGVLVEMDVGMHRVGLRDTAEIVALADLVARSPGLDYRGVMFYPGHIREHVDRQEPALQRLNEDLHERIEALRQAGLAPATVSAGSTPAAFASHTVHGLTEIRPGTYVFNDRTTAEIGACSLEDCALTVLATVVSTAVPGQAVVDAGSKALGREPVRGGAGDGFGALADRPEVTVSGMSEEHGILDLSRTDWRPVVGDHVRIVPNHVCYVVNLHPRLYIVEDDRPVEIWEVAARGWTD